MGRHVHAIGQKRHGVIGEAADDLDHHEKGGDDGGPFGAGLRARMAFTQEDMIACPYTMIVRCAAPIMVVVMIVLMPMPMPVTVQGVIVRHDTSLARPAWKIRRKKIKRLRPELA